MGAIERIMRINHRNEDSDEIDKIYKKYYEKFEKDTDLIVVYRELFKELIKTKKQLIQMQEDGYAGKEISKLSEYNELKFQKKEIAEKYSEIKSIEKEKEEIAEEMQKALNLARYYLLYILKPQISKEHYESIKNVDLSLLQQEIKVLDDIKARKQKEEVVSPIKSNSESFGEEEFVRS